jgi:hypothetical protein
MSLQPKFCNVPRHITECQNHSSFLITTTGSSLLLGATDASAILTAINLTTVAAWTDKKEHAASRCATKTLTESF